MDDIDRIKKRVTQSREEDHRRRVEKLTMQLYISRGFDPFKDKDLSKMSFCILTAEQMLIDFEKAYSKN